MQTDALLRLRENPDFAKLADQRARFGWTLAIIIMAIYFAFIIAVAFLRDLLAIKVTSVITLAFPLGLGVILAAIVITGLYVLRANSRFDSMTRALIERAP